MVSDTYEHFLLEDWFGVSSLEDPYAKFYGATEEEQLEYTSKMLSKQNQILQYAIDCNDRED